MPKKERTPKLARVLGWTLIWFSLLFILSPVILGDESQLLLSFANLSGGLVTLEDEPVPFASVPGEPVVAAENGSIAITYLNPTTSEIRVQISANGSKSTPHLKADGSKELFPAQFGSGSYTVQILRRVSPSTNTYTIISTATVNIVLNDAPSSSSSGVTQPPANSPYLVSSVEVNWNSGQACIRKAKELTAGLSTNSEKARAIYNYLAGRLTYDIAVFQKQSLPAGYKPNLDTTFSTQKGICYDFSALFAGMCRSVGVPAKLCKGYADDVQGYHAWNQVDMDGSWITVDLSVDAQLRDYGRKYSMQKSDSKYRVTGSF